ncbi:tRNA (adenosine(37)-N6)-threonylcarbamoyltransferase complex ATPase subunit type 1 TsaE [Marinitoga hydrogenitolerans]|uniref:tRNA (adenosine(37)-N6)-threonylcarbamoyltransferase complex ATPase subunit type 1 TsaE n=1 Tax=Marinitoga hydrogenitolerans TaxID=287990 RepID=UPI000B2C51D2|nr:tRNA (adenosine(37)-N6)-threonylcarbamoyltransferase complex ATPase subunit type 1 TsaE [Marinitoga hydrogenitolerans]
MDKINEYKLLKIAQIISKHSFPGMKILLYGDLGTGKTTFTKGFIKNLLKDENLTVTSPTFALVKVYDNSIKIYHADLYRLSDPEEIPYIGLFEDNDGIYLIEWPERLEYYLPEERLEIHLFYNNDDINFRDIEIIPVGKKYTDIFEKLKEELK